MFSISLRCDYSCYKICYKCMEIIFDSLKREITLKRIDTYSSRSALYRDVPRFLAAAEPQLQLQASIISCRARNPRIRDRKYFKIFDGVATFAPLFHAPREVVPFSLVYPRSSSPWANVPRCSRRAFTEDLDLVHGIFKTVSSWNHMLPRNSVTNMTCPLEYVCTRWRMQPESMREHSFHTK